MESLKNLIYSKILLLVLVTSITVPAVELAAFFGLYDFTDGSTRIRYNMGKSFLFEANWYQLSQLSINTTIGLSVADRTDLKKEYKLYMIPFFFTLKYDLLDPISKIKPFIYGGLSLHGKYQEYSLEHDEFNPNEDPSDYSFTYGYHMGAGLDFPIKIIAVILDIKYNIIVPNPTYEKNMSAIVSACGISVPLGKKRVENKKKTEKVQKKEE